MMAFVIKNTPDILKRELSRLQAFYLMTENAIMEKCSQCDILEATQYVDYSERRAQCQ